MSNRNSYFRKYYRTSWSRRFSVLLGVARCRERKNKILITITKDDLIEQLEKQEYKCFYTGVSLLLQEVNKYNCVSIDRLDNTIGYISGNVVITTWLINRMKSNLTRDRFVETCKMVADYRSNL